MLSSARRAGSAGILVGEARKFAEKVILAKISRAVFHQLVRPGDTLLFHATIDQLSGQGAAVRGTVTAADQTVTGKLSGKGDVLLECEDGLQLDSTTFVFNLTGNIIGLMFDIALVALLVHPQSRDYQRIWFK